MNEADVSKQVQQMVHFIRQEAEEKANEISISAEEELNVEKLQMVEAAKKKIREEYDRKEKQVEVRKKVEYSTQLNASRLKLLQAQDDLVHRMKAAAEKQLFNISSQQGPYSHLLEDLIIQGLLRLREPDVQLRCRREDFQMVQSVIQSAKEGYATKAKVPPPEIFVDDKIFLPGPPQPGYLGSSCSGGVVLATKDGRIVLENTLDARLELVSSSSYQRSGGGCILALDKEAVDNLALPFEYSVYLDLGDYRSDNICVHLLSLYDIWLLHLVLLEEAFEYNVLLATSHSPSVVQLIINFIVVWSNNFVYWPLGLMQTSTMGNQGSEMLRAV